MASELVPDGSSTAAIHADALAAAERPGRFSTNKDVAPPLSFTTTFTCPSSPEDGHVYARDSGPTRERCEALLAAVEGCPGNPAHAVLYATGLAACFGLLARLLPAKVAISGGYHGTHSVLKQLQRISGGERCQTAPLPPPGELGAGLQPGDVVWLETPKNPTCEVVDISAYVAAAREAKLLVVVDATFAPPPLQRPLTLGAHAVMHATTKYLAGHSDALGGAICVADAALARELRQDRTSLGSTPGAMEVWLLLRSLRTLHIRVERQSATAAELAAWLQAAVTGKEGEHELAGLVHAVHYASLPSSPYHEVATRQMRGGCGGVLALELASEDAARALPGALTLFRDATSLGGVESLIEWRRKYDTAVSPLLLRLSIGLEDREHLQADLRAAILQVNQRS